MAVVMFPDGSRVRAASLAERRVDDPERAYGCIWTKRWAPTWSADLIAWPDFGVPADPDVAARLITDAFLRARRGELVEVGRCPRLDPVIASGSRPRRARWPPFSFAKAFVSTRHSW